MSLVITGVIDGPLFGGLPKAIELFVTSNIADLSSFGIGSANNGGGSDGEEFTFPAVSANQGDYIYVASEGTGFAEFFGFAPDHIDSTANINGDDAIELFQNGVVIDLYGDINTDGTGQAWDHLDSWASRKPGTAPSTTFDVNDWNIPGANVLDGATSNATAPTPFPLASFDATPPAVEIVINEIHADPANNITGDANGDGTRDATDDEFIELVNAGAAAVDMSGYTLSDAFDVRHTIPAGTILQPGDVLVVFGGGTPTGSFDGATVQTASSGSLGLNNSGDTITLLDASAVSVASETYGSEAGNDQSITRDPSLTGDFAAHTTAAGSNCDLYSPGELLDGTTPPPVDVKIHEIQGAVGTGDLAAITVDDISPLNGSIVSIQAIVTADFQDGVLGSMGDLNGFYVQEEDGDADGDALTSEGLFISDGSAPGLDVAVGDLVDITGIVAEAFGETRLNATDISVVSSGNLLPTTTTVSFPVANVALDDNGNYVANLEAYEGMLISVPEDMVVTELFNLDRFGQYNVSTERLEQFTQNNDPSVSGFDAHLQSNAKSTIVMDDGQSGQNPNPITVIDGNDGVLSNTDTFRMGDTITNATGVLGYSFDEFRIQNGTGTYTAANPQETAPADLNGNFKVASLNVLNYFTTLDLSGVTTDNGSDPRGADNQAEFDRQAAKIVEALTAIDADIVGLVEIENDFAGTDFAIQDLVDRVNADLGATVYGFVDPGQEFIGGDAIANGLIYKVDNVNPLGSMAILESFEGQDFTDPLDAGRPLNRPAIAQTFEDLNSGETLTVSVNHFKSKGSLSGLAVDDAQGDGQGNNNATRAEAANMLAAWLATDPTGQGAPNTLILGDLNAYGSEDPVKNLEAAGYTDLADAVLGDAAYSYVFDGQIGTLDYAMANASLAGKLAGATEWHINSDEADAFDYNLDFGRDPTLFDGSSPARNSDHDPVIVSFYFGPTTITNTDDNGTQPWVSYTDTLGSDGVILSRFTLYDDGREATTNYVEGIRSDRTVIDVNDAVAYTMLEQMYDSTGERVQQTNTFDDGKILVTDYEGGVRSAITMTDTADAFIWASIDRTFDALGDRMQQTNTYDDGRVLITDYINDERSMATMTDVEDNYAYASYEDVFDASGERVLRTTTYDDGRIVVTSYVDDFAVA